MRPSRYAALPAAFTLALLLLLTPAAAASTTIEPQVCGPTGEARTDASATATTTFFAREVERVFVHVAIGSDVESSGDDEEASDAYGSIEELLEDRYEVIRATDSSELVPTDIERLIVVDNQQGTAGKSRLYVRNTVSSLLLHPSTAADDLASLLYDESDDVEPDDVEPDDVERDEAAAGPSSSERESPVCGAASDASPRELTQSAVVPTGPGVPALWDLAGDEVQILTGYTDDASFDVLLPLGWAVSGPAEFSTDVVASEIARQDLSLRVDLDDRPTHTWSLTDRTHVAFPVAPELFDEGGFTVDARTTTPIVSDVVCPDAGHVGRWVDIGAPLVRAEILPGDLDVARAVAGIGQISQLTNEPVTVVIDDDQVGPETLQVVGAVAAAVGHYGAPAGWHVIVEAEPPPTGSVIRITPRFGEPGSATVNVSGGRAELNLAGDPTELVELADAMAHPDRLLYFHQQDVTTSSIPPLSPATPQEVFGFAHAGYDDRTLRGNGEKSLVYRLHIPAGVPPDRATLALYGTYAPVLADRESTVSVRINGSEEEIVAVADETGRLEILHTLTAAKLRPGLNFVKVTVDLGNSSDLACSSGPQAWLTVSRTSGLAVELEDDPQPPELGVEDTRFALATTVDFTAADVVITNDATSTQIAQALVVIGELASRADGGAPRLVADGDESPERHLVVVGQAADRPVLSGVLPLELGESVGLVAALPSPHTPGRVLLAMTGGTDQAVDLAIEAALSARVNDVTAGFALVGMDNVRPVTGADITTIEPELLAYAEREPGPEVDDYQAWLLAQAARIESAAAPQAEVRRMVAFGLLLAAAGLFAFGWIRRIRQNNTSGVGGSGAGGSGH